ncbi:MAG: hypothetical protein H8E55_18645 [Pelagibacterales bacterium]|nr:hypothetical protein [Pelagibacterales bacterium]
MITREQTGWTLAKEYPNCGFSIQINDDGFKWSDIIWNEDNEIALPTEQEAEDLWNNKWSAEWDNYVASEQKKKDDKVSAYRKLSMTDDEIRAIDPSLLD